MKTLAQIKMHDIMCLEKQSDKTKRKVKCDE